jgi:hypothetical protein
MNPPKPCVPCNRYSRSHETLSACRRTARGSSTRHTTSYRQAGLPCFASLGIHLASRPNPDLLARFRPCGSGTAVHRPLVFGRAARKLELYQQQRRISPSREPYVAVTLAPQVRPRFRRYCCHSPAGVKMRFPETTRPASGKTVDPMLHRKISKPPVRTDAFSEWGLRSPHTVVDESVSLT